MALERDRSLIRRCRDGGQADSRRGNLRDQVLLYRRFGLMRQVTDIGLSAGMPLSATLIPGAVNAVLPDLGVLKYLAPASRCSGSAWRWSRRGW